jgi:hypothetical protein
MPSWITTRSLVFLLRTLTNSMIQSIKCEIISYIIRDVVESLIEEYKAAEKPDYVDWGFDDSKIDDGY